MINLLIELTDYECQMMSSSQNSDKRQLQQLSNNQFM